MKLPKENTTIVFDNERRNLEVLKQIEKVVNAGYRVVLWMNNIKEKDINDMILSGKTKNEIQTIIEKNTYQGNMDQDKIDEIWRKINGSSNYLPTPYQEFIHLSRYSRWLPEKGRRETWNETVSRYFDFFTEHVKEMCDFDISDKTRNELEVVY